MYLGILCLGYGIFTYYSNLSDVQKILALPLDDPDFLASLPDKIDRHKFDQAVWLSKHKNC